MNYSDIICNKTFNESWHKKLELAQYNADLAIAVAIWGANTDKRYQELGLESLQNRWVEKIKFVLQNL